MGKLPPGRGARLPDGAVELTVDPQRFHGHLLLRRRAQTPTRPFMAHAQRSGSWPRRSRSRPTAAAWRMKPSWAVFGQPRTSRSPPQLHPLSRTNRAGLHGVTAVRERLALRACCPRPDVVADVIHDAVQAFQVEPGLRELTIAADLARGFRGRRGNEAEAGARAAGASTSTPDFPVLSAGAYSARADRVVELRDPRRGPTRARSWDVGRVHGAAERAHHRRHPLA